MPSPSGQGQELTDLTGGRSPHTTTAAPSQRGGERSPQMGGQPRERDPAVAEPSRLHPLSSLKQPQQHPCEGQQREPETLPRPVFSSGKQQGSVLEAIPVPQMCQRCRGQAAQGEGAATGEVGAVPPWSARSKALGWTILWVGRAPSLAAQKSTESTRQEVPPSAHEEPIPGSPSETGSEGDTTATGDTKSDPTLKRARP